MKLDRIFSIVVKKPLLTLIIFGCLFRIVMFTGFYHSVSIFPDSEGYFELSKYIANFDLENYNGMRSPGYSLLINLCLLNVYVLIFLQFFVGVLTSLLWFKALINLSFTKSSSLFITVFISFFLNVFFFETSVLIEAITLFFISLLVFLWSNKSFETLTFKKSIYIGFVFAYLVLLKPFFAFLPFLFFTVVLINKVKLKNYKHFIIIISFPLIAFFGWSYVNKVNTGLFVPTTYYGLIKSQNCVYFAEKAPKKWNWIAEPYFKYREKSIAENKEVAMSIWYAYEDGAFDKYNLTFQEFSNQLGMFADDAIANNKMDFLYQVVFRSWVDYWKPAIYWNYDKFNFKYANKVCLGVWYIQYAIMCLFQIAFLLLIPLHCITFFKDKKITNELFLILLVLSNSVLQAMVVYGTNDRYSYPFDFITFFVVLIYFREKNWLPKLLNNVQQ